MTTEPTPIHEKALAAELNIERDVLKRLRAPGGILEPLEDWYEIPGRGIFIAESGRKKIEGALAVRPEEPAAAAQSAPEGQDLTIARIPLNNRVVQALNPDGGTLLLVRLERGPSPYYRPGLVLRGCTPLPYAGQWTYSGPKPLRSGAFPA